MDGQRFDALARALATGSTRRTLFKGSFAAFTGSVLTFGQKRAARASVVCGLPCSTDGECSNSEDGCFSCCNGVCVNTSSDPNHCETCNVVCPGSPYAACDDGICYLQCPDGWTDCGDYCADLANDLNNCQACGNVCNATDTCCSFGCSWLAMDDLSCGACGAACAPGLRCCNSECIDASTDDRYCGSCEIACAPDQRCRGETCVARCPSGQLFCDPDCVDAQNDRSNCGSCGAVCDGNAFCQAGQCVSTCAAGTTDCGDYCADLLTDQNNCGACGTVCSSETRCQNGTCIRPECPKDQTRCQDGCFDLKTDANHCGGCFNVCIGELSCCGAACVDLKTAATHCGACGRSCPPGYTCLDGGCLLSYTETGITSGRQTASPEICKTSARPYTDLRALIEVTPSPTPVTNRTWAQIAKGEKADFRPASSALRQTITDSVLEVSACGNAGDPARQTALMTDDMARRWLIERGITTDTFDALASGTPLPLPPMSWEVISSVGKVFDLGQDRASALVSFEPPAVGLDARNEIHVFMNEGDRWLLHDVLVVDQASGDRGTIVARLFDCPPGTSAAGPAGSCDLMPELAFQYELVSADGKMRKGIGDATFATRGVLEWSDLPAGTYLIRVLGASSVGVSLVMAGGRPTSDGQFEVRLPVGGKRAVIDIYHQWRFYSDLLRRISGSADNTISCPPCNTMDPVSGICTPNCAPCSKCRSVDIGNGAKISSCVGSCPDSTICVENRCCADIGAICKSRADCCNNNCVAGTCVCSREGDSCEQSACCTGTKCDRDSKSCAACGARDAVCSNDDDCCEGQCFDGHCRCCAIFAVLATDKDWGMCCEYPQVSVVVGDSQYGPEFGRCCTPGIDCPGDPKGPPKAGLDFGLGYWTC